MVDDDMFIRDLVTTKLRGSDYEVYPAASVNEGLSVLSEKKVDAIILDLDLHGESGIEILRKVRSDLKTLSLPVLIFSNNDAEEVREEVMGAGATAFIVKVMMDMNELKREIDRLTS